MCTSCNVTRTEETNAVGWKRVLHGVRGQTHALDGEVLVLAHDTQLVWMAY
jgi:hypothetical protein